MPTVSQKAAWLDHKPSGHAHSDYNQDRPLFGAIELGFRSIEADVFPINGDLWVGHDRLDLEESRTLESMYLKPLAENVMLNGGTVYGDGREVILLIDIKENPNSCYEIVKGLIGPYLPLLTSYEDGNVCERAIRLVLSGERPIEVLRAEAERYAFIDGRMENLFPSPSDPALISMVSANFNDFFSWSGLDEFSDKDRERLLRFSGRAHSAGQLARFWGTPDDPDLWELLKNSGIDLIGTDQYAKLADYLEKCHPC